MESQHYRWLYLLGRYQFLPVAMKEQQKRGQALYFQLLLWLQQRQELGGVAQEGLHQSSNVTGERTQLGARGLATLSFRPACHIADRSSLFDRR